MRAVADAAIQELAGRVALVTGGASGIGRALGTELAARGCTVVLGDRQEQLARDVARGIDQTGGTALAADLDVRDLAAFETLAYDVRARFGRVDFLFNNAGIGVGGEMDGYAPEDWDDVFDVNLRGVANGVQAVYPILIKQRSGHIVNTASIAGLIPSPSAGSYTATKHAVVGLTKALRVEAKRFGVRVSVLCPGVVRTPALTGGRYGRLKLPLSDDEVLRFWERLRPMAPQLFARRTVDAVLRNRAVIVVPRWWKTFWYLERLSPSLSLRLADAMYARRQAELAVAFDMQFLDLKTDETGIELRQPVLDTLLLAAVAHPEEQEHTLESMAARLGLTVIGRHTALGDARLTGEILLRLLRMLAAHGIVTLGEARRAARQTYHARVSASLYERR
jgi:NAD(P)-dependent dehydrogenase (short-subunit alcohol dehydrogenase family)